MLGLLRLIARTLTGRVEPHEFSLGAGFGIWLALCPVREVQADTGWLRLNACWLAVLFLFLLLRASIPIALLFLGAAKLLAILFLDAASAALGRFLLEGPLPQAFGAWWYARLPSWQLHTYWGLGGALLGLAAGAAVSLPLHLALRRWLPALRERLARNLLLRGLSSSLLMRALNWWTSA